MNRRRAESHLRELLKIAEVNQVQVHFLPRWDLEWGGLYVFDRELGAGIAIREDLPVESRAWVLAHELGHHFAKLNHLLFSPFDSEGSVLKASPELRSRPTTSSRLDSEENWADQWAARTLIDSREWIKAEDRTPLDLKSITAALGLPLVAGVAWELQRRAALGRNHRAATATLPDWQQLVGSVVGEGGHQALFRRLQASRVGRHVKISFSDFSLARQRVLSVRGGWLRRYEMLLAALEPQVKRAGGVTRFFSL